MQFYNNVNSECVDFHCRRNWMSAPVGKFRLKSTEISQEQNGKINRDDCDTHNGKIQISAPVDAATGTQSLESVRHCACCEAFPTHTLIPTRCKAFSLGYFYTSTSGGLGVCDSRVAPASQHANWDKS